MAHSPLELMLLEALEEAAANRDIDIVDVEVVGTSRSPRICVRIDHADEDAPGITLDEISEQNDWIDALIDTLDPFESSYMLEVSSPGLDRPLRRPRDFERFAGSRVSLTTTAHEGRRRYTGTLSTSSDASIQLICDDGTFNFSFDEIESCRIKPDFGLAGKGSSRFEKGNK